MVEVIVFGRIQGKNVPRSEFCCCIWGRFLISVWFAAMTRKNCSMLKPRKLACYNSGMSSIAQTKEEESEPRLQHSNRSLRSNTKRRVIFLFPRSARYSPRFCATSFTGFFLNCLFQTGTIPLFTMRTTPKHAKHSGTPTMSPTAIHSRPVVNRGTTAPS